MASDDNEPTVILVLPDEPQTFVIINRLLAMMAATLACGPIKVERVDNSSGIAGRSFSCEGSVTSVQAMLAALSGGN